MRFTEDVIYPVGAGIASRPYVAVVELWTTARDGFETRCDVPLHRGNVVEGKGELRYD
jgi:hypothetical protein